MDEKVSSQRYSHHAKTVEAPATSSSMRRLLIVSISAQLITGLGLFFVGIYAFTLCDSTTIDDFAGITPILGAIFCVLTIGLGLSACKTNRTAAVIFGVFNFILSALLVIYESVSFRCAKEDSTTVPQICSELRSSFNGCRWMDEENTQVIHLGGDKFATGRIITVLMASIGLISSITTLIFLSLAMQLGRPVYLVLKRHKCSIVVGQAKNGETANENKLKNLEVIMARLQEEDAYDAKKKERLKEYFSVRKGKKMSPDEHSSAQSKLGSTFNVTDKNSTVSTIGQISYNNSKRADDLDDNKRRHDWKNRSNRKLPNRGFDRNNTKSRSNQNHRGRKYATDVHDKNLHVTIPTDGSVMNTDETNGKRIYSVANWSDSTQSERSKLFFEERFILMTALLLSRWWGIFCSKCCQTKYRAMKINAVSHFGAKRFVTFVVSFD